MDKEYLSLLQHNTALKEKAQLYHTGLNIAVGVAITFITVTLFLLTTLILVVKNDEPEEAPVASSEVVSAPNNSDEKLIASLTSNLQEKDNEIAQLRDRIAFLSFSQAMYKEEEKETIVPTDWREYVNLFTIGQKVPLPDIDTNTFRCMDYRTITDTTSWQYNIQLQSFTNNDSGLRYYEYNGQRYYTVALATAYGIDLGNAYRVELENGTVFNIIHAEYKHDIRYPRKDDYGDKDVNYDGNETCSVIEFIYDWTSAPQTLIDDGEANRYLGEGCDIYGTGCNIKSMTYLGKIWSVN